MKTHVLTPGQRAAATRHIRAFVQHQAQRCEMSLMKAQVAQDLGHGDVAFWDRFLASQRSKAAFSAAIAFAKTGRCSKRTHRINAPRRGKVAS